MQQRVNLGELVQQAIATLTIARPQSAVAFRIPQPLPSLECDRTQINERFTNLISNAIEYNDKAEKWVEIGFIEAARPDPTTPSRPTACTFYIRNNGIGIAQEHLDSTS